MLSKARVRSILGERLSGREAGRLWLMDSWEVDRGREGFLSDADHARIRKGLKSAGDILDFNEAIDLYRALEFLVKDAQLSYLQASIFLERLSGLWRDLTVNFLAVLALREIPLIVTEKQFRQLKAKQKKQRRQKLHCLGQVYEDRAEELALQETGRYLDDQEEEAQDRYLELAQQEIQALIEAGKLKPRPLDIKASDEIVRSGERDDISWWAGDELGEDEEELLLTGFSGEELARAGLPEWISDIEEFRLYLLDKEDWYGDDAPPAIAILQEDSVIPSGLRGLERGTYKPHFPQRFRDITCVNEREDSLGEQYLTTLEAVQDPIVRVIERRQVLKEAAPFVGVNTLEDVDQFYADLERRANAYNREREEASVWVKGLAKLYRSKGYKGGAEGGAGLEVLSEALPLELEKLRPTEEGLKYGRSILEGLLGKKWWLKEPEEGLRYAQD